MFLSLLFFGVMSLNLPPFYHQTVDITVELEELTRHCNTMQFEQVRQSPKIGILSFNKDQNKSNKAFIVFGEHARELISPETGMHFVKKLCSQSEDMKAVTDNYELKMIVNLNPSSRQKVEQGDFCLRENENGVDLNRNYKAHWSAEHDPQTKHTDPGPFAFSEAETQTVRDEIKEFKPDAFLSIHSGTLGLFTPYAYEKDQPSENIENMMAILGEVKEKHCEQCKVGACGSEVGYLSAGTSMDYAYDMKIPYSFTFEIFHQNIDLRDKKKGNRSFLQKQNYHNVEEIEEEQRIDKMLRESSCFAEAQTYTLYRIYIYSHEMPNDECFKYFNPESNDQYDYYVENWSSAITLSLQRIGEQRSMKNNDQQQ